MVSQEAITKLQQLPEDKCSIVVNLIDQLSVKPIDIFEALCQNGCKNPMTEDEVEDFVSKVREERDASGN